MEKRRRKELATAESARRVAETTKLTRIDTDESERLAADRTKGNAARRVTPTGGGLAGKITGKGRAMSALFYFWGVHMVWGGFMSASASNRSDTSSGSAVIVRAGEVRVSRFAEALKG